MLVPTRSKTQRAKRRLLSADAATNITAAGAAIPGGGSFFIAASTAIKQDEPNIQVRRGAKRHAALTQRPAAKGSGAPRLPPHSKPRALRTRCCRSLLRRGWFGLREIFLRADSS